MTFIVTLEFVHLDQFVYFIVCVVIFGFIWGLAFFIAILFFFFLGLLWLIFGYLFMLLWLSLLIIIFLLFLIFILFLEFVQLFLFLGFQLNNSFSVILLIR